MKKWYLLFVFLLVFIIGCENNNLEMTSSKKEVALSNQDLILIDLKGAINYPGVYEIKSGTNLYELVRLAGGFKEDADTDNINLVQSYNNSQMVIIPSKSGKESANSSLININNASLQELMTLPFIGEGKAQKIIDYRNTHGSFNSKEELLEVSGIGNEVFNKFKDYICI